MWRRLYFLPIVVSLPIGGVYGVCDGYTKYNYL